MAEIVASKHAAAKILRGALTLLDGGRAWCRPEASRSFPDAESKSHRCAYIAVHDAAEKLFKDRYFCEDIIDMAMAEALPAGKGSYIEFNDHIAESFNEMEKVFKKAIRSLKDPA